ncbi:MAG: type IV pilin protein [Pseudomonadales bacterium]
MERRAQGFTLTELLVAIAIVAVVSAIALPLYTQYSQRTYAAEVQADLLNCAQSLERFSALNFSYAGTAVGGVDAGLIDPDICDATSVRNARYAISINATATGYTLTAVPQGGDAMAGTGNMTLDDAGARTWDDDGDNNIAADENDWIKD